MKLFTLLCCINPTGPIEEIDEFTFYQMINPIVPVENIKIFDKNSQVKAFVQVENEELADLVIKDLHGIQMNIGKIKVFISHKKFITFDKSLPEILAQSNRSAMDHLNINEFKSQKPGLSCNPYVSNSVTGFKNKIQSYSSWKLYSKPCVTQKYSDKVLYSKQLHLNYDNSPSIYLKKKLAFDHNSITNVKNDHKVSESLFAKNSKSVNSKHLIKVVNIDTKNVTCQMIFNFFGCFGNILRLGIDEALGFAIIEYENDKTVQLIIKHTDCIKFCGRMLNVVLYNDSDKWHERLTHNNTKFILHANDVANYRFTNTEDKKVVFPSRILHISNLPKSFTTTSLNNLISKIHHPLNIITEKSKIADSASFLVEFNFLFESIKVLAILHNSNYDGNILSVSFFKRKSNNHN